MKRLLILNTNFPPSTSIGTQRILRISKYLDHSEWEFFALTLKEKYYAATMDDFDLSVRNLVNKMNVYRTGKLEPLRPLHKIREVLFPGRRRNSTSTKSGKSTQSTVKNKQNPAPGPGIIKKMARAITDILEFPDKDITFLPFAAIKGYRIIKKHNIDAIYTSSPPHSLHLSGVLLKILTGKKLIVDFRDPWARSPWHDEERVSSRFERLKHLWINCLEQLVVKKADQVICVSQQMTDDFIRFYPKIPAKKFHLFYNGFDPDLIQDHPKGESQNTAPKSDKLVFMHIGSLYKKRDPTPLILAIKHLLEEKAISENLVQFQFLGVITPDLSAITDFVKELNLSDIIQFIPPVSYRESFGYMKQSDVLILLQPITKLQIPGKFYDYIYSDKPILAIGEKNSAVESLVKDRFGQFVDIQKQSEIEEGIKKLVKNPHGGIENYKIHKEEFNMAKSVSIFAKILDT